MSWSLQEIFKGFVKKESKQHVMKVLLLTCTMVYKFLSPLWYFSSQTISIKKILMSTIIIPFQYDLECLCRDKSESAREHKSVRQGQNSLSVQTLKRPCQSQANSHTYPSKVKNSLSACQSSLLVMQTLSPLATRKMWSELVNQKIQYWSSCLKGQTSLGSKSCLWS